MIVIAEYALVEQEFLTRIQYMHCVWCGDRRLEDTNFKDYETSLHQYTKSQYTKACCLYTQILIILKVTLHLTIFSTRSESTLVLTRDMKSQYLLTFGCLFNGA